MAAERVENSMGKSRPAGGQADSSPLSPEIRREALSLFPEPQGGELADPDGQSLSRLFPRDPASARRSADSIMAAVGAMGRIRPGRAAAFARWGAAMAAAAAIAIVSSLMTVAYGRHEQTVSVRFVLSAPDAQRVSLAADFTGWSVDELELIRNPLTGEWEIIVPLKKGRGYFYNFVIDGEAWVVDPSAPEHLDDGLGGRASYLSL
mgnify:CR=1 FL=1